jgi:hypothetical protein
MAVTMLGGFACFYLGYVVTRALSPLPGA